MGNSELTPEAQSDLIEIWSYIAQHNEEAANNLIDKIYQKSQALTLG
ncbi:MAG: type II toxin-antitoxin system RelE/ParE family toxin [Cyanobacteria bacterium J06621_8]